jgi:hypothetical protein
MYIIFRVASRIASFVLSVAVVAPRTPRHTIEEMFDADGIFWLSMYAPSWIKPVSINDSTENVWSDLK